MGLAHRDLTRAQQRFTDAVLELHAESGRKLEEARSDWAIPSNAVYDVLKRFRKLR